MLKNNNSGLFYNDLTQYPLNDEDDSMHETSDQLRRVSLINAASSKQQQLNSNLQASSQNNITNNNETIEQQQQAVATSASTSLSNHSSNSDLVNKPNKINSNCKFFQFSFLIFE